MTKVTLSQEQAKAIENIRESMDGGGVGIFNNEATVIRHKLDGKEFLGPRKAATYIPDRDFIQALINGYDVEQTPEEKLRSAIDALDEDPGDTEFEHGWNAGFKAGVRNTVHTYGLEFRMIHDV